MMKKLLLTLMSASLLILPFLTQANDDYRRVCRMHHDGNIEQYQQELEQKLAISGEKISKIAPDANLLTALLMPEDINWQEEMRNTNDPEIRKQLRNCAKAQEECLHFQEVFVEALTIYEIEAELSAEQ